MLKFVTITMAMISLAVAVIIEQRDALGRIETAVICRDVLGDPATARRLVERSLNLAARPGRPQVADRARAVLETLTDPAAGDSTK